MNKQKNPLIAFLLAFMPGFGLMYLGYFFRGLMFMFGVLFFIPVTFIIGGAAILAMICGFVIYVVSIIYTAYLASKMIKDVTKAGTDLDSTTELSKERFYTIVLSVIPGLGHFQLGLMNRGITFLASFLGIAAMIIFVTALTSWGEFLVFLLVTPVIWVYNVFDVMQLLKKKQDGEELVDRSILEDFEKHHEGGKKSKAIATFLSMFPGAGHLYLGYQRRGVQLMAAFLFSIYILDILRLGIFLFLVPIIWFFSFFDGLQRAAKHETEPMDDAPIVSYFINHQKWIGIGLVLLGVYYLLTNVFMPALSPYLLRFNIDIYHIVYNYLQTALVCVLLIGGGIKLLAGSKRKSSKEEASR